MNNRIRKVDGASGLISTVAGTGTGGFNADGIPATSARLARPNGAFVDGSGNIYIAGRSSHRVRMVDTAGIISTVAATGTAGVNGDGIPATTAQLSNPVRAFVDRSGNLFIADLNNHRVRKVDRVTGMPFTGRTAAKANLLPSETVAVPDQYVLEAAYPNPFNPSTTIRFGLPESAQVRLVVFDVLGRQVRVLLDGTKEAGTHEVVFDADGLPSGTYLYRLETPHSSFVRTMLLAR